jgi:hypothetical protein
MKRNEYKEERMKILELLAKKIVTAEEAENLLSSIGADEEEQVVQVEKKNQFKMLKIIVDSADGDKVNIQLPIEFAKLLKSNKFANLNTGDLDLDIDQLIEMIQSGASGELVNINSADGDTVRILVE